MFLQVVDDAGCRHLTVRGHWVVDHVSTLSKAISAAAEDPPGSAILDGAGIERLDLTGAWLLRSLEQRLAGAGCAVSWAGERPATLAFVDEVSREAAGGGEPSRGRTLRRVELPLHAVGEVAVLLWTHLLEGLAFLGAIFTVLGAAVLQPRRFRLPSIVRHVYETGITAVPIVSLIAFLISVIVAYIGAQQLRQFGGEIFVVDLVTISVLREFGVLLTAIIVAGRSGSAFAAEIGVMKLNDEVDALRAIGMDPIEVLVSPRVLGLVIALPLLTVVADAMGLAGGMLLSWYLVDIPINQFIVRMNESIADTTFWVGLVKAPVFAFLIAMIGTFQGMRVHGSSRELGRLTTVAVVQSIFMVIFADAVFAVVFLELDI
jgi:phospholipid/cholesterol/gamma-HCH transport system permease protein